MSSKQFDLSRLHMRQMVRRLSFLGNFYFILVFYSLATIVASIQKFLLGNANNFFVFKYSFFHLLAHQDLYILHLTDHLDLYKYSPAIALLIAPIAILPSLAGAVVWNLLNLIPLLFAIKRLALAEKHKIFIYWIIFFELLLSLQNFQSNGLTLALIIFGFIFLEEGKPFGATFFIVLSAYIKIFGLAAGVLFALYPRRGKTAFCFMFWMAFFALLPLTVVSLPQLKFLYLSWFHLLRWDNAVSIGLSVAGFLKVYLGFVPPNLYIQCAGIILLLLPLLRFHLYANHIFRYFLFCSLLIWLIIFNHKAESPTFIIALLGIAIWFTFLDRNPFHITLLAGAFVLISLSSTDLVPRHLRDTLVGPYLFKVIPCIFIWLVLQWQLLFGKKIFSRISAGPEIDAV